MKENQHIDKIISGKIKDFEKNPPPEIWENIQAGIQPGKRKILPVIFRYAAGIAMLIGIGGAVYFSFRNNNDNKDLKLITEKSGTHPERNETIHPEDNSTNNFLNKETVENSDRYIFEEQVFTKPGKSEELASVNYNNKLNNFTQNDIQDNADIPVKKHQEPFLLAMLPVQINVTFDSDKHIITEKAPEHYSWDDLQVYYDEVVEDDNKLSISALLSPQYSYRNVSSYNYSDQNNVEKGKISYAGGLEVGYQASERFSIYAGLAYSKMSYEVGGVVNVTSRGAIDWLTTKSASSGEQEFILNNSIGTLTSSSPMNKANDANMAESYSTINNITLLSSAESYSTPTSNILDDGLTVNQYFHFMEIPVMMHYKIIDKDIDLKLLGGFSTNYLFYNKVTLNNTNFVEDIGQTRNINSINFTGNLGIGLDYSFNKNFILLFEPQFKYFINSINNVELGENHPYTFGFYTGMRYFFN